jgi:hypothetical protein
MELVPVFVAVAVTTALLHTVLLETEIVGDKEEAGALN